MTDKELMRALFAEGLPPHVIAEKFEVTQAEVLKALGISTGPRQIRTYQRFWRLMGDQVLTSAEVGGLLGQESGYANVYLHKLEQRGQVRRAGTKPVVFGNRKTPCQVLAWQMIKIEELLPAEPEEMAA